VREKGRTQGGPAERSCSTFASAAAGGGREGPNVEFCPIEISPRLCTIEQFDSAAETIVSVSSYKKAGGKWLFHSGYQSQTRAC
jgi:hypothetical protein